MVVRLRLARHGTRNNPFYHVVAINDSKPRDARPIEKLGEYDPIPRPVIARPRIDPKGKAKAEGHGALMTSGLNLETRMQKRIEWNEDRIKYWLSTGAQPSKPVARLLDKAGLVPPDVFYKGMYRPEAETARAAKSPILDAVAEAKKGTPQA